MSPGRHSQHEAKENWAAACRENLPGGDNFIIKICQFLCEQIGLQLGLERATLETDSGTLDAIKFYNKTGWTEVNQNMRMFENGLLTSLQGCRYPWYPFRWIHGTELIRYYKQL